MEEVLLRNYLVGIVELKWLSNLRLPQNGGAVLLSNDGNSSFLGVFSLPTAVDVQHFWKQLLAGSLSGGRQFIISPAGDSGSEPGGGRGGGGSWKGMYSRFVKSKGEEGERTQAGGNLYISAYLEVVITVSGFIFPCITGCDGPLGRVWHGSAINNITNVQNQR